MLMLLSTFAKFGKAGYAKDISLCLKPKGSTCLKNLVFLPQAQVGYEGLHPLFALGAELLKASLLTKWRSLKFVLVVFHFLKDEVQVQQSILILLQEDIEDGKSKVVILDKFIFIGDRFEFIFPEELNFHIIVSEIPCFAGSFFVFLGRKIAYTRFKGKYSIKK